MFNSNILDIIITLSYTFLLLALMVSTLTEIINTIFKMRSKYLELALKNLFDNLSSNWEEMNKDKKMMEKVNIKQFTNPVFEKISKSPFIKILLNKKGKFPSYIPSNNISSAILDVLIKEEGKLSPEGATLLKNITQNPANNSSGNSNSVVNDKIGLILNDPNTLDMPPPTVVIKGGEKVTMQNTNNVKDILLTLYNNSNGNLENFIKGIEKTYDDCMGRATGWFKKRAQIVSIIIATLAVTILNVDSVTITKSLWSDKDKLQNAVALATNYINNAKQLDSSSFKVGYPVMTDTSESGNVSADSSDLKSIITIKTDSLKNLNIMLSDLNLPIGWEEWINKKPPASEWGLKIIGLLISIMAVYLGAPFWFDTLSRFVNIRGAGTKPKENPDEKTEKFSLKI